MPFISYAQNFEDVILHRALGKVKKGFYVDVGACFPDLSSVTKAFYDKGWKGINIEPSLETYNLLVKDRPRDINLNMAMGRVAGETTFYQFDDELGSSSVIHKLANKQIKRGRPVSERKVPTVTLNDVFEKHVGRRTVHFLKIDVEGLEDDVLAGIDLSKYRPWIIVVEAMMPWQQKPTHETWEPRLLSSGYLFAYADGLNRFYVAEEHSAMLAAFAYPPNVFDKFILSGHHAAETMAKDLEKQIFALQDLLHQSEERQKKAEDQRKLSKFALEETRLSAFSMAEKLVDLLHGRNKEWAERIQQGTVPIGRNRAPADSDQSIQASLIQASKRWDFGRRIDA